MTPPTPKTLRAEAAGWRMRQHFATADLLDAAADAWQLLIDAVNDDTGECLPECNSFGHAEGCQYVDMAGTLVRLKERLAEADEAMRQALSDFEWAEKTLPGTNFQASILLLRHALAHDKEPAVKRMEGRQAWK